MNPAIVAAYIGAAALIISAIIGGVFLLLKRDKSSQSARAESNGQALNVMGSGNAVNAGGNVHIGNVITQSDMAGANVYQNPNPEYRLTPSPKDVEAAIAALPPLQRSSIVQHYIGLKVRWKLMLFDISRDYIPAVDYLPKDAAQRSRYVRVTGSFTNDDSMQMPTVVKCFVILEEYPYLNLLRKKDTYWVNGEIAEVDDLIGLKDARLEILADAT